MKLLLDQHLSRGLIARLGDLYPGSSHVLLEGLGTSLDIDILRYALTRDFVIVSKDSDFRHFAAEGRGKVIHLAVGNGPTSVIEAVLRRHQAAIADFGASSETLLVLWLQP